MTFGILARRVAQVVALAGAVAAHPVVHLRLVKSEPAIDDSLAQAPGAIKLWFSQKPEMAVTAVRLKGADGRDIALAAPRFEGGDPPLVVADVKGDLGPGHYAVSWKTSSADGHILTGTFPFTVRPAPSPGGP